MEYKVIFLRFARAFLAGAVAQMAIILAANPAISTLTDLQNLLQTLAVACVAGGLMALDKLLRFEPQE